MEGNVVIIDRGDYVSAHVVGEKKADIAALNAVPADGVRQLLVVLFLLLRADVLASLELKIGRSFFVANYDQLPIRHGIELLNSLGGRIDSGSYYYFFHAVLFPLT